MTLISKDEYVEMGLVLSESIRASASPYPLYAIGLVTADNDGNLQVDSVGTTCELRGIVYGPNYRPGGLTFVLIDGDNNGITVFDFTNEVGYTVTEGGEISVKGTIGQFRGLIQMGPDEITVLSTDNTLVAPTVVTTLGEATESQLVRANNLTVVSEDGDNVTKPIFVMTENGLIFSVPVANG